jgi:hypothetical protein
MEKANITEDKEKRGENGLFGGKTERREGL